MFETEKMATSKDAVRQKLAHLPIAEKLALLDVLRERQLDLRSRVSRVPVARLAAAQAAIDAK